MPNRIARSLTLLALCALPACASTPEPSYPDVSGRWTGAVDVEGESIPGTLTVTQDMASLAVTFGAPAFGLTAEGSGTVTPGGEVTVALTYDLQCPGTANMAGDLTSEGAVLSGTLEATDCTGTIRGLFSFRR